MRIKNWSKHQHCKDRRPPWIKVYREILEQRDIMMISPHAFRLLVLLWVLASEDESMTGTLPTIDDIAFRLHMDKPMLDKYLQELGPWLEQDDNKTVSTCYQDGSKVLSPRQQLVVPETETETETETEKEAKTETRSRQRSVSVFGEFKNVKLTTEEYAQLKEKHGEQRTAEGIEVLSAYIANSKKGQKYANHYAVMHARSWVWDEVDKRMPVQERDKPAPRHWDANTGPVL